MIRKFDILDVVLLLPVIKGLWEGVVKISVDVMEERQLPVHVIQPIAYLYTDPWPKKCDLFDVTQVSVAYLPPPLPPFKGKFEANMLFY